MTSDNLQLKGWILEADPPTDGTILLCHGWGENKSKLLTSTYFLSQRGRFNLFYFDFRGHGESRGGVSSLGSLESLDFSAALDFLRHSRPHWCERLGVYGLSLGAAVALWGAARFPEIRAVAAESSFASYREVVTRYTREVFHFPKFPCAALTLSLARRRLGHDPEPYSPLYHVGRIAPRPVLLIYGEQDRRSPLGDARRLLANMGEPKELWVVPGAGHAECAEKGAEAYQRRILDFFKRSL